MQTLVLELPFEFCENGIMFLAESKRRKDGKDHRYYRIVESRRGRGGRSSQRTLLYLGEINHSQKAVWIRSIDVVMEPQMRVPGEYAR